ncbi:MAG: Daunorubicin resistance transporter, ATP-binding protein [Ilumatobacteraceae bacterium]|nr:Daunorubicin resistance transporter, ATP-binding protein [Ilumatobacteraceae bacterium]
MSRDDGHGPAPSGVVAHGLGKRYGDLWALRDLDLEVPPGTVLGLLGHNGAGKTTAIRILTTLTHPSEGSASVAGFDVATHGGHVRQRIGVAAQQATVDGLMSARLNLDMVGRLYGLSKAEARRRGDALLEQLELTDASNRLVKTFSGGMRRRLDLAASIMANPEVLFLDEPTTGLDPRSRGDLWQILRDLVREGTTIILTTQYLEEADRLADDIVVLDHGRTVAHGTPADLKARIGDDRIDVTVSAHSELVAAAGALSAFASNDASFDEDLLIVTAPIAEGTRLIDVVRALDEAGIDAVDMNRRQATLDEVFLALTSPGDAADAAHRPGHIDSAATSSAQNDGVSG